MASLAESLLQQISAARASTGGGALAADGPAVEHGLEAAIPTLITALSRNAQSAEGASALHEAIAKDHDGSVIDNLPSYLQNPNLQDGDGILKHALGGQRESVQSGLAQQTGLDMATVGKLLQFAAPLVLGMLAKQQRSNNLSPGDLSNILKNERDQQAQQNPDLMQMLSGMLDMDKDGGFMDDVQGMVGKLFNRRSS